MQLMLLIIFVIYLSQVFNEICSRRINDEYDFFAGLITSPTFMSVLIITVGLQALIINVMGIFFKVSERVGIREKTSRV